MTIVLCEGKHYVVETKTGAAFGVILVLLYIISETFSIIVTSVSFSGIRCRKEKMLGLLYGIIHVIQIMRVWYFLSGIKPFCYPEYLYEYFREIGTLLKDVCAILILTKVLDVLTRYREEHRPYYKKVKMYLLCGIGAHFLLCQIIIVLDSFNDYFQIYLQIYGMISRTILLLTFLWFAIQGFRYIKSQRHQPLILLKVLMIFIPISLILRITQNSLILSNFEDGSTEKAITNFGIIGFTELVSCLIITLLLADKDTYRLMERRSTTRLFQRRGELPI